MSWLTHLDDHYFFYPFLLFPPVPCFSLVLGPSTPAPVAIASSFGLSMVHSAHLGTSCRFKLAATVVRTKAACIVLDQSDFVFQTYFGLVAKSCRQTMELCKIKAKSGFTHLKIGGYFDYTPWDTLLLVLVGEV